MAIDNTGRPDQLHIDVEPDLRRKIETAAAEQGLSLRDYVVTILQRAIEAEERNGSAIEGKGWAQHSAQSFARDWDSEEDREYDRLS